MPRGTVTVDPGGGQERDAPVLLDEEIQGAHLGDQDSSEQFRDRLAGSIKNGAKLEHVESVTSYLEVDRC